MIGQWTITAEVTRRTPGRHAQPAGFDEIDSRCDLGNDTHDRFELTSISSRVVVEQHDLRATLLSLSAALADHDTLRSRRSRPSHDTM